MTRAAYVSRSLRLSECDLTRPDAMPFQIAVVRALLYVEDALDLDEARSKGVDIVACRVDVE